MTEDQKQPPGTAIRKERKPLPGKPWQGDALGSKKIAEKLTNAVEDAARAGVDNAYVIGLHGEWGTGKTFLLQNWCEELKSKEKSPCVAVYYNAWEDDFLENPLVAIIAKLQKTMCEMGGFHSTVGKFAPMLNAAGKIIRVCFGNIDVVKIIEVVKIMLETRGDVDKSGNTDEVNLHVDLRKETDVLQKNLRDVIEEVKKETKFPLVFVIDELDRCRPVFALEVLERVKHLFNVPGVVFVLGFNKTGLKKSIEKVYGYEDVQSEKYLRRFFDREVSMPFSSPESYCDHLLRTSGIIGYLGESNSFMRGFSMIKVFVPMAGFWGLTLREVEGLVRLLSEVVSEEGRIKEGGIRGIPESWVWPTLCLIFLKVKNPALYSRVIEGEISCKDLIDEMMEMFCDEKNANPQYQQHFKFCQDMVEDEIYRLAGESEWKDIINQMKTIRDSEKPYPACPALAKRTMELGKEGVGRVLKQFGEYSRTRRDTIRVPVKDITSLIELNDVE